MTGDQIYALERTGVVRVQATTCDGSGSGSGYFISDRMVVTAAHVVEGATAVSLRGDHGVVRGTIVGLDKAKDVALVRAEPDSQGSVNNGFVFTFAPVPAKVGTELHVLGYPLGHQLSMSSGTVTSTDARIDVEDRSVAGVLQLDAASVPGNSGGPVVDRFGQVIGSVEAAAVSAQRDSLGQPIYIPQPGINYAVPSSIVAPAVWSWKADPRPVPFATCAAPSEPPVVTVKSSHVEAPILGRMFEAYFGAMVAEDYESAWQLLSPAAHTQAGGYDAFTSLYAGSTFATVVFEKALMTDVLTDTADVSYRLTKGSACRVHHVKYTLRLDAGHWRIEGWTDIDKAKACT